MEKGGKGYSPFSNGSSLKGKDDSAPKSGKKKVQFAYEGSSESRVSAAKSGGASIFKGEKGDKIANGGKSSASRAPPPVELKIGQDFPEHIQCLMDCEASEILKGIQNQMVSLSKDPTIKIPVSFDRGLQYAKSNSQYTNPESVRRVLDSLTDFEVTDSEICLIANVCPETVDEVFALVPSLKAKQSIISQTLKGVLGELAKLKKLSWSHVTGGSQVSRTEVSVLTTE